MSFRTRCTGAIYGAFLFTIGAPLIFLDTRRNAERVISGDVDPLSRRVAKTVYSTGAAVPTLVLCGVTALLYPAVGWLAAPLTLAISCAIGAAFGAVLLDLTEPAPLGTPGNPRPMPGASTQDKVCKACGGSGWVVWPYPKDAFTVERRCGCNPAHDLRGPDLVATDEDGTPLVVDFKTAA